MNQWSHLKGPELPDIYFGTPGIIDVLIGADTWGSIVEGDIIGGRPSEPYAQHTRFGWVVFGPASVDTRSTLPSLAFNARLCEDEVHFEELVQNFWKLEEVPVESMDEDTECERTFASTHSRTLEGRYVVQLPFRRDAPKLGESYTQAIRQFKFLEHRLGADPDLKEKYVLFMREYIALGHMERVDQLHVHTDAYYIPHHAMTDKFRVVFNASAKTSTGASLNDTQLVGPTIQDSLINILLRFRRFRVAITADIEKMFRQILVAPSHRDYQRIIWRESPLEDIGIYRLTTITYGMACSPFSAVRALNQCAYDNYTRTADNRQAAKAREAILTSFYVDDFLVSCDNDREAINLANNVDAILSAGHFKLRKWNSNSPQIMESLTETSSLSPEFCITSSQVSVLGLRSNAIADQLFFNEHLKQPAQTPTKRRLLSEVGQLFDPTGLLAPVVVTGKIFIQRMGYASSG